MTDISKQKRPYLQDEPNNAADLIRSKLKTIYKSEPDAVDEAVESAETPTKQRTKHQQFMYELTTSGKPLAEVQTAWHNYYISLSDKEKHEVWQEFYAANKNYQPNAQAIPGEDKPKEQPPAPELPAEKRKSVSELKDSITKPARNHKKTKLTRKQHLQSLAFGLGMGSLVLLFLLFGFFNERFIAPFITPNKNVSATPLILDGTTAVGSDSKLIIPKVNVEVPVVYDVETIAEAAVQKGLERGVVHYATTPDPGQKGNAVIFGHSSNNLLNTGDYKFAFVLLSRLTTDDIFYIEKDGTRYVYKVIDRKIVKPNEVSALDTIPGKLATVTLITCDPPGTAINRLLVVGEQVSPDPTGNKDSTALSTDQHPEILAGNAESLWHRIVHWVF